MATDNAVGADQDGRVEVDAVFVDLRHADHDVAGVLARQRRETVRGWPRDRLDKRRDLGTVEPAIARRSHFRRDDQLGAGNRRLLAEIEKARNVALLLEHGRLELDGGDFMYARHGLAGPQTR
ncbi:hypothetical protein ACVWYH_009106 [Bradyrhizobium sp. GM24.11]